MIILFWLLSKLPSGTRPVKVVGGGYNVSIDNPEERRRQDDALFYGRQF